MCPETPGFSRDDRPTKSEGASALKHRQILSNVPESIRPPKYFSIALRNSAPSPAFANNVIDEQNFKSSGNPKISAADFPSTPFTIEVHSLNRPPNTACPK
jgi:hypothetical protein